MRRFFAAMAVVACALTGGSTAAEAASRLGKVARVVDGDTVRVTVGSRAVDVDLLGVRAATGCGADGVATLRALLPRGTRVRIVRDGAGRGAYVVRRSTFVNAELLAVGAARTADLRGLRRAAALRAAQRQARRLQLGVWACDEQVAAPAPAAGTGVDTPESRAELDRYVRGHRFTVRERMDGQQYESVAQFCPDGRFVVQVSDGLLRESATGTWKLLEVVRRDGQRFLGRLEVTLTYEGETDTGDITIGHRGDGSAVIVEEDEETSASRAPADAC